jgi:hypothetical protein
MQILIKNIPVYKSILFYLQKYYKFFFTSNRLYLHFVRLKIHFVGLNCTLLKENPLKMSEFLKNEYFFNEKFPLTII